MISKSKKPNFKCPFCDNDLPSRNSKCFNIYCRGNEFNLGNLVIYRLNPRLGIGRIIKIIKVPASKTLDEQDTFYITKYKVKFPNNVMKIVHPIDLIHKVFTVNEQIITNKGIGTVNSNDFYIKNGIISYEILYSDGKIEQVEESDIIKVQEPTILDIIGKKEIDPPQNFLLKYWANLFYSYYTSHQIKCITNSRLSLMPHQINVAHRLSEEFFPRLILADEVGLGKTIEAGIFIKEMMARNLAERVLIIAPATLVKQWHFEMENKFNINFTMYDGKKVRTLLEKGSPKSSEKYINPFYHDNLIICSLQFARNERIRKLLAQISWDIVVFDEAHHLRRYLQNISTEYYRETLNYKLAKELSESADSFLLLTATPLQLHSFELFSLVDLIQRGLFQNFSDFEHFRKNLPFINLLISNVNNLHKLNNFELHNTIRLLKNLGYVSEKASINTILNNLKDFEYKNELLKKIEEDHTLAKVLIRNRKKNVFSKEFINKRIAQTIIVKPTRRELEVYNEIRLYLAKIYNTTMVKGNAGLGFIVTTLQKLLTSSKHALLKSLERRLEQINKLKDKQGKLDTITDEDPDFFEFELEAETIDSEALISEEENKSENNGILDLINQERILKEFKDKLERIPYDSKANKLLELLEQIHDRNPTEKVLIFTQFIDTLFYLKDLLKKSNNSYHVEIFYGGMNKDQKDEAVERFKESNKFSIMLSTEIGGEGRNFQFCRILINYDLPWNPMRLEQRIGRLDRIGQKSKEIYIYNFFIDGTVETDIIYALDKRIHLFEESIGQLEPILGNIESEIKNIVFSLDRIEKIKKLRKFREKLDVEIRRAREMEMKLDDLLIDKKSFQAEGLFSALASCREVKLSYGELFLFIYHFFNQQIHDHGEFEFFSNINEDLPLLDKMDSIVWIKISDNLARNSYFKLKNIYIGTFSLSMAREREDLEFFALGHPLINHVINYCRSSYFNGDFTILKVKKSKLKDLSTKFSLEEKKFYLLIFKITFQGFIIENQYLAVIIDDEGNEIEEFSDIILDISYYPDLFSFDSSDLNDLSLNMKILEEIISKARNMVNNKTSQWKSEIKRLNDNIYRKEVEKREKIYQYKKKVLTSKLESLELKLSRKKRKLPTKRQMENINKIDDETKKIEKLNKIKELKENIKVIESDILKLEKKLDELEFEYMDLQKDMKKRNQKKFLIKLSSLAMVKLVD